MLDLIVKGGLIVDGTGAPGRHGDVGVRDGRVVSIGKIDEAAARTVDATDRVVSPGFVDLHTHYDAQAFWDSTLSPSPLHGVTTVVGGNCGFTIAPLTPDDGDYLMRMLARVEGMPLESLQQGVPWNWRTTAEYFDRLDGTLMPNAGFLVGHSALRRVVMHDDAVGKAATPAQLEAMCQLLRDGLAAGGLGFSSTWSTSHSDHNGDPVPSRHATKEEVLALCRVVREFPGTTLEFIPAVMPVPPERFELMGEMSAAADRPLNWNVLTIYAANREVANTMLAGSDIAESKGGRVFALTLPDSFRSRLTFKSGFVLDMLPNWAKFVTAPEQERVAALSDPIRRGQLNEWAQSVPGTQRSIANWGAYRLETFAPENARWNGKTVGEVATERGVSAWEALCDIVVADNLLTGLYSPDRGQDEVSWAARVEAWRDPRTIVGASDAGAHLDMIDSFGYSTTMLAAARDRSLMPIEEAVQLITDRPARIYGLKGRGRVAEGWAADLVVFDPSTVGPAPLEFRLDLPGGAGRIYGEATGVHHVLVNGTEVVTGNQFTDARPGTLLRSGRDTETVSVSGT